MPNKVINLSILILCCLFTQHDVLAQQRVLNGQITTAEGKVVEGELEDLDWSTNPTVIKFSPGTSKKFTSYHVSQIKGFRTENSLYESRFVGFEKNLIQTGTEPILQRDTLFLEVLIKGALSLYHFREKDGKDHFFIRKNNDQNAEELILRKTEVTPASGQKYISTLEIYKNQLNNVMAGCSAIAGKIKLARYTRNSLQGLLAAYYNSSCSQATPEYVKINDKTNISLSLVAGAAYQHLVFSSNQTIFKQADQANITGVSIPVGLAVEFNLPKQHRLWSVTAETMFQSFTAKGNGLEFKLSYLKESLALRRYFGAGDAKPFITLGPTYSLALRADGQILPGDNLYNDLNKSGFGLMAGGGVRLNRFSTQLRFERSAGVSNVVTVKSYYNTGYLLLSYRLAGK